MGAYVSRFVPDVIANAVSKKPSEITVQNAIEDIQKLSQDDIHEEFERIFQHMHQGLNKAETTPCAPLAQRLLQCIRKNKNESVNCFHLMEAYRTCIADTFQEHIKEYLREHEDEHVPPLLPLVPPPPVIQPQRSKPLQVWHSLCSWLSSWFQ